MGLEVEMCGVDFLNPFILASGPPTADRNLIKRGFKAGWGGAVTKTIVGRDVEIKNVSPRLAVLKCGKKIVAMQNIELVTTRKLDEWLKDIKTLKEEFPEHIIIGSIMSIYDEKGWQSIAEEVQSAGADMLELNLSCPHGMPEKGAGAAIGQNADMVKGVVEWVKDVASVPVLAKLTPNVTDIAVIAKAAKDGGADGISAINTVLGFIGIDVGTLNPKLNVFGKSAFGGISGTAIKPIGLRCVAEISKSTKLPVSGIGGVSNWEDAVEYMLLGATTVQVCTAVMLKGFGIIGNLIEGLSSFMREKKYKKVSEFIGLALDCVVSFGELDSNRKSIASISTENCSKCYSCVTTCSDGGFKAISIVDEYPVVDASKCDGCGLCVCVCPQGCIKMKEAV